MNTQDIERRLFALEEARNIFNSFSIQQLRTNQELNENLTILLGVVRSQGQDISSLKSDVATIKTDLSLIKDRLSTVESRLERVETRLDSIDSRLDTIITLLQKGE